MMKRKIRKTFERQTPDVLQAVLSACQEKGGNIVKQEKWQIVTPPQNKKLPWLGIAAAAAVLALIVGVGVALWPKGERSGDPQQLTAPSQTEPTITMPTEIPTDETEPTQNTQEPKDWTLEALVSEYQLAPARASLVLKAWQSNPEQPIEELIGEEIQTLMVMHSPQIHLPSNVLDYASVKRIVLEQTGEQGIWNYEAEYTGEIYEVSFCSGVDLHRYEVDAISGEILQQEKSENPDCEAQFAASNVVHEFFNDLTGITFERKVIDLTKHMVLWSEVWAEAIDFLPFVRSRYYYDEMYLSNQTDYILEFAEYWRNTYGAVSLEEISYVVENVRVKGGYAQVCIREDKTFYYPDQTELSSISELYEIMLVNHNGTWLIFDLATEENIPEKYKVKPVNVTSLVQEDYTSSYRSYCEGEMVTWMQSFPKVMIDSDYADEINAYIAGIKEQFVQWEMTENSVGIEYRYDYYGYGDLLTLIFTGYRSDFGAEHHIYTLHISDGRQATREEILAFCGMSEEELVEKSRWIMANSFLEGAHSELGGSVERAAFENAQGICDAFGQTVCIENLQAMSVYLDRKGELCFQAKMYQMAGADYHHEEHWVSEKVKKSQYYDRLMVQSIGREMAISRYSCGDAVRAAIDYAGAAEKDITDLMCEVYYALEGASYYKISFTYQGEKCVEYIGVFSNLRLDME